MPSSSKRVVIVGGVAAGTACATRLRRLDESARITLFERGPHVSFASCGLPYHVGEVIPDEQALVIVTPERFRERFGIDVQTETEVTAIDREARHVEVRDRRTGRVWREPYDALVLATGTTPIRPDLPGLDLPGVFTLRTVPEARAIREWIQAHTARRAVVVGGGFIGLEIAENLALRGLEVQIVEAGPQVLPHLDPEMAARVTEHVRAKGVGVHLGEALRGIEPAPDGALRVQTSARALPADLVVMAIGVRPTGELAGAAGLSLTPAGAVAVDAALRTEDPHIWAVGDAVEKTCAVTGQALLLPLAGPASRQGRLAADGICGRPVAFRGVQGTAVLGVFDLTVASTGTCEKVLRRRGTPVLSAHLHPLHHVSYYPGAEPLHLKLVYAPDGRVLGAQAIGRAEVARRVDVIAMAVQMGATVFDLEQAELCYAPAYGAARDPVNVAGMIAANQLRGDLEAADWADLGTSDALLVDVREPEEFAGGHLPGAVNVPLSGLRASLDRLPSDRPLWLYCQSGKRSYDAARALAQLGFTARSLPGGIETWRSLQAAYAV